MDPGAAGVHLTIIQNRIHFTLLAHIMSHEGFDHENDQISWNVEMHRLANMISNLGSVLPPIGSPIQV